MSLTLYVRTSDYPDESSWRLAKWCLAHEATEFSLAFLVAGDVHPSSFGAVDAALASFRVGQRDDRFVLSDASLTVLKTLLPQGLFSDSSHGESWIEDPTFYRGGVPLLKVVTHEGEAVLTIEPDEQITLDTHGLTYHLRGVWV